MGLSVWAVRALRELRALQSRRKNLPAWVQRDPPPGSQLVASVLNKIKLNYPFVDLLKPETDAMFPLLLAFGCFWQTIAAARRIGCAYQLRAHTTIGISTGFLWCAPASGKGPPCHWPTADISNR